MTLAVHHEGPGMGPPYERCCMCRKTTQYWHKSDVALCQTCAKTTKLSDLPTKKEWCDKERNLENRLPHDPR